MTNQPSPAKPQLCLELYREDPRGVFQVGWKRILHLRVDARHLQVGDHIVVWYTPGWDVITGKSSLPVTIRDDLGRVTHRSLVRLETRFYKAAYECAPFTAFKRITVDTSRWG